MAIKSNYAIKKDAALLCLPRMQPRNIFPTENPIGIQKKQDEICLLANKDIVFKGKLQTLMLHIIIQILQVYFFTIYILPAFRQLSFILIFSTHTSQIKKNAL